MIALYPSPATAEALAAQPGASTPPEDLHLTLVFLTGAAVELEAQRPAISEAVRRAAAAAGPLRGVVGGIGLFAGDADAAERPLVALADVPGLNELRADLMRELGVDAPTEEHGFTPHLTLAYVPKDAPLEAVPPPELPLAFEELELVWAGERETFPLGEQEDSEPEQDTLVGASWVSQQGGLPPYIERIARHLETERGMDRSRAIATAVNTAKRMASNPDGSFWPGVQGVNVGSRREAATAVAQWEAMKAAAAGRREKRRNLVESRERPSLGAVEERSAPIEAPPLRVEGNTLHGLIPYGVESRDLGGWKERLEPGCLSGAVTDDLIATVNHDVSRLLGRYPVTLKTEDRADGMAWQVDLPNGPTGQDVREAVRRGDLRSTSWRMVVGQDRWDGDVRVVEEIRELRDVAVVANPAYMTTAELRSQPDREQTEKEHDEMEATTTTEDRTTQGGLTVEDRTVAPETTPDVEARIHEMIRGTAKGESRSLTLASADSITPPQIASYLFDRLRPRSVALSSGIRVVPTDRKTIQWPQVVSDPTPEWVAETEVIPATDPVFTSLEADPKKLAARTEFSNEVLDDSEPDAEGVVRRLMERALALKLDLAFFQGNPSADPDSIRGLKFTPGIQALSMGTNGAAVTDLDVITDALGMLEDADVPGPFVIVMRPSVWRQFRKLTDAQGRRLLGDFGSEASPNIDGVRVFTSNQLAANETQGTSNDASSIYVYSVEPDSGPALVRRKDVQIELDRSRLFHQDMSEMRGKTRVDLLVPQPSAVLRITGVRPAA